MNPESIHFVSLEWKRWPELFDEHGNTKVLPNGFIPEDLPPERFSRVDGCWIVQTFLEFRRRGYPVCLSSRFKQGTIAVVSQADYFALGCVHPDVFIVSCQADTSRSFISDYVITQNRSSASRPHSTFIPHWPQPGLIPRDRSRGARIENVDFKGFEIAENFKSANFSTELSRLGLKWRRPTNSVDYLHWQDYGSTDVILAVRGHGAATKPASKLTNSWAAGVPALLSPDPAYLELQNSPLDFIEVRSLSEALLAIQQLLLDPGLYLRMIANGLERSQYFSREEIFSRWRQTIEYDIFPIFNFWLRRSQLERSIASFYAYQRQILHWRTSRLKSRIKIIGASSR